MAAIYLAVKKKKKKNVTSHCSVAMTLMHVYIRLINSIFAKLRNFTISKRGLVEKFADLTSICMP